MKKCFLVLLAICFYLNLAAQTVTINNTPGAYSGNIVIGSSFNNATEAIYLASEIGNANFTTVTTAINRIEFSLNTLSVHTLPISVADSFRIYLKNVNASINKFATGSTSYNGYTKVYDGNLSITSYGWSGINLTTPFMRTDSSNLQILIVRNNNDSTNVGAYFDCSIGNINSIDTIPLGSRRYNGIAQFVANTNILTTSGFRPAIQLIHSSTTNTIPSIVDSSLVAYFPFNGNAGDSSVYGNHPIFNNATLTTDRFGNTNSAYSFNGSSSYMRIPNKPSLNSNNTLSLCLWVKPQGYYTGLCYNNMMLSKGITDNYYDNGIYGANNGNYTFRFADYVNGCNSNASTSNEYFYGPDGGVAQNVKAETNKWYYLVFTTDGTTGKFYINNKLEHTSNMSSQTFTNAYDLFFGRMNNAAYPYWFNGVLDDIRIYNRAITSTEIAALYNNYPLPTPCTSTTSTTNATIAFGNSYTFNGTTYTATGVYAAHLINAAGCDSTATLNLIVTNAPPLAITGASTLCVGSQTTLTANINGGIWSSGNNRASVNAAGIVTGASAGIAIIKYKLSNGNATTYSITVNGKPNIPSFYYVAGTSNPQYGIGGGFCANKTFTVVGNPSGGVWSKTGVIAVTNPAGVVTTGSVAGAGSLTYTYTNNNGCSNSRTISGNVIVCASRGVNTNQQISQSTNQQFTMYPNPAKSFVTIDCKNAKQLFITDCVGKTMQQLNNPTEHQDINTQQFPKGIYLVSIITNEGKTTKKLVIE